LFVTDDDEHERLMTGMVSFVQDCLSNAGFVYPGDEEIPMNIEDILSPPPNG